MSGSRWVITPSWLSGSWRSFLYSSSVYSCHLFFISSASVRSIPFLSFVWAHLCMKCSLCISNFLEEISSLSHSVVCLYFFALIAEEGFLISPSYSLELCIQMLITFHEEIPHVQGKRNPSKTVGVARGHQRADVLKPQWQKTSQSDHTDHSLV